uniref:Uncharacterized protein n=1 Tax=Thermogemmatispora argillosa TaxID=2045280 RepID=A0A455T107_9CHLR|nr:hypothetical protein KTA_12480 [Thermogemmatispora argillosa]
MNPEHIAQAVSGLSAEQWTRLTAIAEARGLSIGDLLHIIEEVFSDPSGAIRQGLHRILDPLAGPLHTNSQQKQPLAATIQDLHQRTWSQVLSPLLNGPHPFQGAAAEALSATWPIYQTNMDSFLSLLSASLAADLALVAAIASFIEDMVAFAAAEEVLIDAAVVVNAAAAVELEANPIADILQGIVDLLIAILGIIALAASLEQLITAIRQWQAAHEALGTLPASVHQYTNWTLPDGRSLSPEEQKQAERIFRDGTISRAFPNPYIRMMVITWLLIAFGACGIQKIWELLKAAATTCENLADQLAQATGFAGADNSRPIGLSRQIGAIRLIQTILSLPAIPEFTAQYGLVTPLNIQGVNLQQRDANNQIAGDIDLKIKVKSQVLYAEVGGPDKGSSLPANPGNPNGPSHAQVFRAELQKLKQWAARDGAKAICFLVAPKPGQDGPAIQEQKDFQTALLIAQQELGPQNVFIVPYSNAVSCKPPPPAQPPSSP